MAFNITQPLVKVTSSLNSVVATVAQTYTISYANQVEEYSNTYKVRYDSTSFSSTATTYTVRYTSLYGDVVTTYTIKYHSGRDLTESSNIYTVKYTAEYPQLRYDLYTIKYTTSSPNVLSYRNIYKVKYTSDGSDTVTQTYTIRYTNDFFKERSSDYVIRYTSETPFMFNVRAVLLRNNEKASALFYIQGRDVPLENTFFVFSNLPRYQLVEFTKDQLKPHIKILEKDELSEYNLFGEEYEDTTDTYKEGCYVVVEGVEELNAVSLDIYDNESLEKRSVNKSFFFNLESTEFYTTEVVADNITYTTVNYSSNYYNYNYLNFIETRLTPLFKVYDDCCFSVKITDTSRGGNCSPF